MSINISLEISSSCENIPTVALFTTWARAAIGDTLQNTTVHIKIVDLAEGAELNTLYRNKPGATNVLSFPAKIAAQFDYPMLGDLVICAPIVVQEAAAQQKLLMAHWAHLVIHGILHLLGFDHQQQEAAQQMEQLETKILVDLGFAPPYGAL